MRRTSPLFVLALALPCAAREDTADLYGREVVAIRLEGLRRSRPSLVLDQMASRIGAPLTRQNLQLDRLLLDRLGIFSSIQTEPRPEGSGVALHVSLKETLPVAPYVSATSTQENGLSAGPAIGAINLFGAAVNASAAVEFGGATNVYVRWRSPMLTRRRWWYELGYAKVRRDNPVFAFEETSQQPEGLLGYQFRPDLRLAARLRLLSLRSAQPGFTLSPSGRDQIAALNFELRYDTRDLWSDPWRGSYLGLGLTQSGGSGQWITTQFDARRYQPLADRHTLAAFSLLSLQTGRPGIDLPVYMTYGIGGANTVRGWPVGARIGRDQWLNTLEYRYRLVKRRSLKLFGYNLYWGLHLAVYGDLGTAWTDSRDFSRNVIGGAGYGVRLVLPYVGVVRFDRAYGRGLRPCYGLGERADLWGDRIR